MIDKAWRAAFDRTEAIDAGPHQGKPHGSIQWKGTDVCMDVRCPCGYRGHIDGEFFYTYRCAGCNRRYSVGAYVQLIELQDGEFADYGDHSDDAKDDCKTPEKALPEAAYSFFWAFYKWLLSLSLEDVKEVMPILQTLKKAHQGDA